MVVSAERTYTGIDGSFIKVTNTDEDVLFAVHSPDGGIIGKYMSSVEGMVVSEEEYVEMLAFVHNITFASTLCNRRVIS